MGYHIGCKNLVERRKTGNIPAQGHGVNDYVNPHLCATKTRILVIVYTNLTTKSLFTAIHGRLRVPGRRGAHDLPKMPRKVTLVGKSDGEGDARKR